MLGEVPGLGVGQFANRSRGRRSDLGTGGAAVERLDQGLVGRVAGALDAAGAGGATSGHLVDGQFGGRSGAGDLDVGAELVELAVLVGCDDDEVVDHELDEVTGDSEGLRDERLGELSLGGTSIVLLAEGQLLLGSFDRLAFFAALLGLLDSILLREREDVELAGVADTATTLVTTAAGGLGSCLGRVVVRAGGLCLGLLVCHENSPEL